MKIVQTICCLSTEFCKGSCIGLSRNQNIKLTYTFFIIITYSLCLLTTYIINLPSQQLANALQCDYRLTNVKNCVREQIEMRVMFGQLLVFLIIFGSMFLRSKKSKIINEGLWIIKILIVVVIALLSILAFPSSNILFNLLEALSVYTLPIYYFFQSMVIIDCYYLLDGWMAETAESGHKAWLVIKTIITFLTIFLSIIINILSYYHLPLFYSILNSTLMGILLIVVLLRISKTNSLLVYSSIMIYTNLLAFTNHQESYSQSMITAFTWIQYFFTCIFLFGLISKGSNELRTNKSSLNEVFSLNTTNQQQDKYVVSNKWIVYHFVMMVVALAFAAANNITYSSSLSSYKAQISYQKTIGLVFAYGLYIWSVVSSRIFPEKDFSELDNYFREFELS